VRAATELLAEERRRREEAVQEDVDANARTVFLGALTPEEHTELLDLLGKARLLKYRVWVRCAEARPKNYVEPSLIATADYPAGTLYLQGLTVCEATPLPMFDAPNEELTDDEEEVEEEAIEEPFDIYKHGPEFFDGPNSSEDES
jgi:hypothetical protein